MDNKEKKNTCLSKSLKKPIIPINIISLILSIGLFIIYLKYYNLEDLYCDVIENSWNDSPIVDISLKKENKNYHEIKLLSLENKDTFCDCSHVKNKSESVLKGSCSINGLILGCNQYNSSKIAHKFFNSTLYISTYNGNYWTFYDRIRKNKYGELACKEDNHYTLCGYLDVFKNLLCVLDGETCPLNSIEFSYSKDEVIDIKYKINGNPGHHIVNRIIASEIEDADFFDINQILTFKNITHYRKREEEKLFKLNYFINKTSTKKDFYRANNFTNEPLPDWFDERNIYYYNIIYPGNKYENKIRKIYITFYKEKAKLKITFFILDLIFLFCFLKIKNFNKICFAISIILILGLLVLIALNIIFFFGAYFIYLNLNEYIKEQQNKIENGNGLILFIIDIVNTALVIVCLFTYGIFLFNSNKKDEKDKKDEKNEKDESQIFLNDKIIDEDNDSEK